MPKEFHALKLAAELTPQARKEIAPKNFALTPSQSSTDAPAYPIHDEAHARAAIGLVGMHGTPEQKSEVYRDIVRKYPHLARGSKAIQTWQSAKEAVSMEWVRNGVLRGSHPVAAGGRRLVQALASAAPAEEAAEAAVGKQREAVRGMVSGALAGGSPEKFTAAQRDFTRLSHQARKRGTQRYLLEAEMDRRGMDPWKKTAGLLQRVGQTLTREGGNAGHIAEVAGLGMLAANPIDELQAKTRAKPGEDWEHKSLLGGEKGHAINDIAGLGVLAAPSVAHLLQHKHAARAKPGGDVVTVRSHVRRRKTSTEKCAAPPPAIVAGFFAELRKHAAVSEEEARAALDRLDTLEKAKPTAGQVGRYAALGAGAGVAADVGGSMLSGAPYFKAPPGTPFAKPRAVGASALRGAVAASVIPLLRGKLDRHVNEDKLRAYLEEAAPRPTPVTL